MFRRKTKSAKEKHSTMGSKSLSSPTIHSEFVDRKTKQKLFYECHVCLLGQQKLHKDESFNQTKAEVLMNRMYNKRQSHCVLYCLEDNIRFRKTKLLGSNPRRNFVRYGCIKHVFLFEDKPEVMMLCIDSGRSDRRTYEAFKFKNKENVLTLCEYIYKATQDPDYTLRDLTPIREFSRFSEASFPLQSHSASELDHHGHHGSIMASTPHIQPTRESDGFYSTRHHESYSASPIRPKTLATNTAVPLRSQADPRFVQYRTYTDLPIRASLEPEQLQRTLRARQEDDDWVVDITYLQWDNKRGATINDAGPIYMYIARRIRGSRN